MDTPVSTPNTSGHTSPSLHRLVDASLGAGQALFSIDELIIIGRQLETVVLHHQLQVTVAIGIMRFSLLRLHQGQIMQLAPHCRSITVYGEADVEPPALPGVEFVALEQGAALCHEWFLVIDSPTFWGALLAQAVEDKRGGNLRRYVFNGALTSNERVIGRVAMLLSLVRRRAAEIVQQRDQFANRGYWAGIAAALAAHSQAERLALRSRLNELPELMNLLHNNDRAPKQLLSLALDTLEQQATTRGVVLYHHSKQQLRPLIWKQTPQPAALELQRSVAGQALHEQAVRYLPLLPNSAEARCFPDARAILAVPLLIQRQAWGVVLVGQQSYNPDDLSGALPAVGIVLLLGQLLAANADLARANERFDEAAAAQPQAAGRSNGVAKPPTATATPAQPASGPTRPPSMMPPGLPTTFSFPAWMQSIGTGAPTPPAVNGVRAQQHDHSWPTLQKRMIAALIAFDQRSAEYIWSEACSLYRQETVCIELLLPVQVAIGEGWHRGEVSVAAEHFASQFVESKLLNLLSAQITDSGGPLAVIGCAQNELHELGALVLALFLRWSGFRVIYLGQNVPNSTIEETIRQLRPQILGLSATTNEAANALIETGQIVEQIDPPRPLFIYGGIAFYDRSDLVGRIKGQYLEGDVRQIARQLAEQFRPEGAK
jgi:methanogenic corrinoid protein MtbC1